MRFVVFPLLAAWAVTLAGQTAPPPTRDRRGGVGVLRSDGILRPFASFDNDKWQAIWPLGPAPEFPLTLSDVPESWWGRASPAGWQAHALDGGVSPLSLGNPTLYWVLCSPRIGLRTSHGAAETRKPVPPQPFAKNGLAITGGVPLEPIETIPPDSPEASALVAQLLPELNATEDKTMRGIRRDSGWRHPLERPAREARPFKLEAWYRSPSGKPGWTVSYVEAVRAYDPGPDDQGCGLETLISGWIHHRDGVLTKRTDLRGKVTYCDRVGATAMLPFGRMTPRERSYWIFQLSGWESEWYGIAEVAPDKVRHVVEVPVGRCPTGMPRREMLR